MNQFYSQVNAISCVTETSCTAVGNLGQGAGPWAGTWDGTSWTVVPSPHGAGAFQSVSCPDATLCVAAGFTGHGLGRAIVATSTSP